MKRIYLLLTIAFVALLILTGSVSAKIIETKSGYVVRSGYDVENSADIFPSINSITRSLYSITDGEINYHNYYVSSGKTKITYDVDWGDSNNDLGLKIITPDTTLGYYHDSIDGRTDGKIYIQISNSMGLPTGTWDSFVMGYTVSGTEYYNFGVSSI
ncbi:peptidase domain-containing protein [Methanoplanus sp. FWC-SCC4]|uniref:Peptidase domain-containing protein n=1 Tax=Methanochimaera problematica TaxID=2609417 RepID=A0AA97FBD5_9EURY|nr:peptidase domain-containing protein [Methanoplanus sp. FWC-SCC4]WOF16280.1 peptidase domain-containing protein [Methanoplanus sp. FWC-SCC4]